MGVLFTQLILFLAAALIGFALGWRLFALLDTERRRSQARDIEALRQALSEAQVRRARLS